MSGISRWFIEIESQLTVDDLVAYFRQSQIANGGDSEFCLNPQNSVPCAVDGVTILDAGTLRTARPFVKRRLRRLLFI
ncbi:MAG: hypothetical protein LBK41_04455 [Clostridiales bacterium]|nr:hypothetical protein [Clostridiales bacterium]